MRFDYSHWQGPRPEDLDFIRQMMEIYRNLLLQTGGDVDEALRWMAHFGEQYGFFNEKFGLEDFKQLLEESGETRRTPQGFEVTPQGEKRIRQDSLNEIFSALQAGGAGDHRTPDAGQGGERLSETRPYQFGDDLGSLDPLATLSAHLLHALAKLVRSAGAAEEILRVPKLPGKCNRLIGSVGTVGQTGQASQRDLLSRRASSAAA